MVISRRVEDYVTHNRPRMHSRSGYVAPSQSHIGPYTDSPPLDVVEAGLRSVVDAWNSGALSEEQAGDLIKVLIATYTGEVVSQHVREYLENGLSHILEHQIEE